MKTIILGKETAKIDIRDNLSDSSVTFKTEKNGALRGHIDWLSAPLYLSKQGNRIDVSHTLTELSATTAPPPDRLSKSAIRDYIKNGPRIQNQSIYSDITLVPPGFTVEIPSTGDVKITREAQKTEQGLEPKEIEELLCTEIQKSLQQHEGKRVCFALSGGVDSTLLVALAKHQQLTSEITCYTADTGSGKDLSHAKAAAEALGIKLVIVKIDFRLSSEH